jgi:thiamine kinase-like enzyme
MEHFEKIYNNLKTYIKRTLSDLNCNEIELSFEKLNGLSNDIYLVRMFDKTSQEMVHEVIYRQFGQISDLVDRELERKIIDSLSSKSLTPRILQTDGSSYRIEEFVSNASTMTKESLKEDDVIERIIQILVAYTMISGVYIYKISSNEFSQDYKIKIDPEMVSSSSQGVKQNIFDMCMRDMLNKARKNFEKFSNNFDKKYNKFLNQELLSKFDKIMYYIKNYNDIFSKIFPNKGFFVLNHNDVHRLNLLVSEDQEKLFILDHEYSALNLVGVDIVNYLIETSFSYDLNEYPYYKFESNEINFENYFEIFKEFIEKFESSNQSLLLQGDNRRKFEKVKTFKYFLRLVCVISLFWLLYSVIYFDYDSFSLSKTFDYFQHAVDRIYILEKAYQKLETLKI